MRLTTLGQLRALGDASDVPQARDPRLEAAAVALIALGSVTGLVLYATGQTKMGTW